MSSLSQAEPCDTLAGARPVQRGGQLLMEGSMASPLEKGGAHLRWPVKSSCSPLTLQKMPGCGRLSGRLQHKQPCCLQAMRLLEMKGGKKKKTPAQNKRLEPVKDVNSKQKQQNFNLWAIMQQVKQSCRLELGDNREFRPGAFNQWTSSVSDPNLNDISDRSFAETLISGGIKKGSRPKGISKIYGKNEKKE